MMLPLMQRKKESLKQQLAQLKNSVHEITAEFPKEMEPQLQEAGTSCCTVLITAPAP